MTKVKPEIRKEVSNGKEQVNGATVNGAPKVTEDRALFDNLNINLAALDKEKKDESDTESQIKNSLRAVADNGNITEDVGLVEAFTMPISAIQDIFERAEKLKDLKPVYSIVPDYAEFTTEGHVTRGLFFGFQTVMVNSKEKKAEAATAVDKKNLVCARWIDENKKVWINGGTQLVRVLRDSAQTKGLAIGTPIEITFKGKDGDVKLYDVHILA